MADAFEKLARAILRRSPDVAHDIKTPLNIVVLNVELLKMRLRSLGEELGSDNRIQEHCRSIDRETRRISAMADAFLSIARLPEDAEPERRDAAGSLVEALREESFTVDASDRCELTVYSSRLAQAGRTLARGLAAIIDPQRAEVECIVEDRRLTLRIEGPYREETPEIGKLFKFYYTDPSGEPNLMLASARLLLESMGGTIDMNVSEGNVQFRIQLQGDE